MKTENNLTKLYSGFYLTTPVGNNAFSYEKRKNKKIWIPSLLEGNLSDVRIGNKVVFSEIEDGQEKNPVGLEHFVHWEVAGKHIFIFDNHNHAFCFWAWGLKNKKIESGIELVHIDQHTDMRIPLGNLPDIDDIEKVFYYTNHTLNVGNFIQPALKLGVFSKVTIIDNSRAFEQKVPDRFVLDIDLDIFAPELDYIDPEIKIEKIREYIRKSQFITLASSPFFLDPKRVLQLISELFT